MKGKGIEANLKAKEEGRSTNFYSNANEMVKCPHPGCNHVGHVITKAHCRINHGITREEMEELHGTPFKVTYKTGVFVNGV